MKEREKEKEAKEKEAKRAQEEMATVDPTLLYANAPLAIEYNPAQLGGMGGGFGGMGGGVVPDAQFGGMGGGLGVSGYGAPNAQFGGASFVGGYPNQFGGY